MTGRAPAAAPARAGVPSREEVEAFLAERAAEIEALARNYPSRRAILLPVLWMLQRRFGWLSPPVLRAAARAAGVSPGEASRVASFYTMFRDRPCGRYVLGVCGTLSCALAGSGAVLDALSRELGVPPGGTTADGWFTLERVECLGWCDRAPVVQADEGVFFDRMTPEAAVSLVRRVRAGEAPPGFSDARDAPFSLPPYEHGEAAKRYPPVLSRRWGPSEPVFLEAYLADGGYEAFRAARAKSPEEVVAAVKDAGLLGRGGAGFSTGLKWELCAKAEGRPKFVVVNADESEPGTFKDVQIIERDPHLLLEGTAIAMHAIGAETAYIYIRGEFARGAAILSRAIEEARSVLPEGWRIVLHRGAGAYICGEETALLESLEGKIGEPRLKPPFPVTHGAFGKPTVVNNVETLAAVPVIFQKGVEWFRANEPKLYCLSGAVRRPGVYEAPYGIPLRTLLFDAAYGGGPPPGRTIVAAFPGGSSAPPLPEAEFDVPMTFKDLGARRSMLGSAGVVALDETVCMVSVAENIMHFYAHESCGKCTPCRDGTAEVASTLAAAADGAGAPRMVSFWDRMRRRVFDDCFCPLAKGAMWAFGALFDHFRDDFEAHAKGGTCGKRALS